jgi:hydroxypyruvate reductase
MNLDHLKTFSLRQSGKGDRVARIVSASLQAADPERAVLSHLHKDGHRLVAGDRIYDLQEYRRVYVIGAGKAGAPMARAVIQILGEHLSAGLVIVKEGYNLDFTGLPVRLIEAGHPIPDQRGQDASLRIREIVSSARADDLIICLVSGGGSALLTSPVPGVGLADLQTLTRLLLASGADIHEINTLRKHLDQVKGGCLARLAYPATLLTLVLSDVVGDPLDMIASGPAVPDPTTYQQAFQTLYRYDLSTQIPQSILGHLQRGLAGEIPETPKPGDPLFARVQNLLIGSNAQAARAALEQADREGFHTLLLTTYLQGEARQAGAFLAAILRQVAATAQPLPRPACLVAGGETTVTLKDRDASGLGGRNQELALGTVERLAGLADVALVTLATDGGDGPTDAAGAVVNGQTLHRALDAGLVANEYLDRNDAYHFFEPLDDLLKPGPTLTNVNDLAFLFAF